MYKSIIPDLVSFDTELEIIKGFNFAENFYFFKETDKSEKFHYRIIVKNDILIPEEYDFRNGYYFRKGNDWYYERKLFGFSLKFRYDTRDRTFYFNNNYLYLPFEIGSIYPIGKHIADLINLDLFLEGYNIFRGCAFIFEGKTFCLIAPGFNGKTNLMREMIGKGAKYISEDILVISIVDRKVYPSACFKNNFGRSINSDLFENLKNNITSKSVKYDYLFFIENSTAMPASVNLEKKSNKIENLLFLCSFFFLGNNFIRSLISEENKLLEIFGQIENIKNNLNYKYLRINNFNFEEIIKYGKSE